MSLFIPDFDDSVVVRAADAEEVRFSPDSSVRLLADNSSAGGFLSTMRVSLGQGSDGARPHHHGRSAEMFYMIDGTAQLLAGDKVVTAEAGDLVIVPPGQQHAFAAAPGESAEMLVVITPGVERFEYFRHLERIRYGTMPPESLLEVQELYDTYFGTSSAWEDVRAPRAQ
ncbi:cupin domain-containing protein [Streptomyces sp. NBC_00091]|uniref:cupin domain-containing protein n=1 Tax=Streptomyces sp. NBC_00091 TaxID=2975648 RepID=UPI0022524E4C|nr:cupin domain-containing protein [Streptomyces sp. NBC_00091]MCX5376287.1 cupin domain-containing protein [Streptomyces sp. NBC_00091]